MRKRTCEQRMKQLPSYRTDANNPTFPNTALDLFGPFEVKVGRKTIKEAWCCIFTCMTSRATFLMAVRRFISLRGHPKLVWSDRGTNCVGAQRYLQEMVQEWDILKITSSFAEFGTSFKWC